MRRHGRLFTSSALACLAAVAAACAPRSHTDRGPVLPFIEDDYAQALTDARARQLPIFVESWAPW